MVLLVLLVLQALLVLRVLLVLLDLQVLLALLVQQVLLDLQALLVQLLRLPQVLQLREQPDQQLL